MKSKKLYFWVTIAFGAIYLLVVILALVLALTGNISNEPLWRILLILAMVVSSLLFMQAFVRFFSQKTLFDSLTMENLYTLGQKTTFYNLYAFQIRVGAKRLKSIFKRKKQFLIAFTNAVHSASTSFSRGSEQNELNSRTAVELSRVFSARRGKLSRRNHVFCFDRGVFLVYCFDSTADDIKELVITLRDIIYKLSESHVYHIQVQPFFGILEANPAESLIEQIDNVNIARDRSESNFETWTYYDPAMKKEVSYDRIEEIVQAYEAGEFEIYYQPKFSFAKKEFVSAEALIRWNSPKYGLLGPNKFMAAIESAGLIHEIDTYVFRMVCADLAESIRRGRRVLPVSINFSLFEFYAMDFLSFIMDTIHHYKIDPSLIEIEITETTSQANQFLSLSTIRKLKENGLRVLMDDFGIGYSNIGNLRKIPFDAIKIDKSYIDDIVTDEKSREIVKTLIAMGKKIGLEVIAEGVDSQEKIDILRHAKCDTIQGFYYSAAISKAKYEALLKDNPFEGGKKR